MIYHCDNDNYSLNGSSNYITIEDEILFHRIMHFCNWKCVREWQDKNKFPIKKENLFESDINLLDYARTRNSKGSSSKIVRE